MCNRGSETACKNSTKESNRKKSKNRGVGGGDRKQESCSNLTTKVEFTPISPTPIRATRACGKKKGTRLRHLDYRERSVVGTLPQSCNADNEVRWSRIRVLVERKLSDARQVSKHRSLNQMSLSTVFLIASLSQRAQLQE